MALQSVIHLNHWKPLETFQVKEVYVENWNKHIQLRVLPYCVVCGAPSDTITFFRTQIEHFSVSNSNKYVFMPVRKFHSHRRMETNYCCLYVFCCVLSVAEGTQSYHWSELNWNWMMLGTRRRRRRHTVVCIDVCWSDARNGFRRTKLMFYAAAVAVQTISRRLCIPCGVYSWNQMFLWARLCY